MRLGGGVAASAVLAGLGLASSPSDASAIIGIDDALLGAAILAAAALGGYALYSQYTTNNTLQALGAGFSGYVSNGDNRTAAALRAATLASSMGVVTTQDRLEAAAQLIADGQGAFADAMGNAASTGRLALDGLISGSDDLVGAFRELVNGYLSSGLLDASMPMTVPDVTTIGTSGVNTLPFGVGIMEFNNLLTFCGATTTVQTGSGWFFYSTRWKSLSNGTQAGTLCIGDLCLQDCYQDGSYMRFIKGGSGCYQARVDKKSGPRLAAQAFSSNNSNQRLQFNPATDALIVTPDLVIGPKLPVVDRPVDVPDIIGAAWDSLPIASDMVINPSTGDITSAGSITLPTGVPSTAEDYAAALQGMLAGVVAGTVALPVGLDVPVTVATPLGVATVPISEAISTETSLQLEYVPDIPVQPVEPPTEVPEGPWTPVVDLPFNQLWPFNMIYSVIEVFNQLGGS